MSEATDGPSKQEHPNERVAQSVMRGLEEALAYAEGRIKGARIHEVELPTATEAHRPDPAPDGGRRPA